MFRGVGDRETGRRTEKRTGEGGESGSMKHMQGTSGIKTRGKGERTRKAEGDSAISFPRKKIHL